MSYQKIAERIRLEAKTVMLPHDQAVRLALESWALREDVDDDEVAIVRRLVEGPKEPPAIPPADGLLQWARGLS